MKDIATWIQLLITGSGSAFIMWLLRGKFMTKSEKAQLEKTAKETARISVDTAISDLNLQERMEKIAEEATKNLSALLVKRELEHEEHTVFLIQKAAEEVKRSEDTYKQLIAERAESKGVHERLKEAYQAIRTCQEKVDAQEKILQEDVHVKLKAAILTIEKLEKKINAI